MSTVDNVFVLHRLITHMLNAGKRFYCPYVDFSKAFDYKLSEMYNGIIQLKLGVRGQVLKVIRSMYENIKSRVKANNELSDGFTNYIRSKIERFLSPFYSPCISIVLRIAFI